MQKNSTCQNESTIISLDDIQITEQGIKILHSEGLLSLKYTDISAIFLMYNKSKKYSDTPEIILKNKTTSAFYCINWEKIYNKKNAGQTFLDLLKEILLSLKSSYIDKTVDFFLDSNFKEIPEYKSKKDIPEYEAGFSQNSKQDSVTEPKDFTQEWNSGDFIQNEFRIKEVLKGGMGIVYIANHIKTGNMFAIKTIQKNFVWDNRIYEMFKKEAELWVKLEKHPNIVQALIVRQINSKPLIFLEYIKGKSLDRQLAQGPLEIKTAISYAIQICRGLAYAFGKLNIIHRDIKPSNCLIDEDGTLKITDFGLAKVLSHAISETVEHGDSLSEETKESHATAFQGTLPYMSPESFSLKSIATTETDIYSIGVVLYEMLSGTKPVFATNFAEYMVKHESHALIDVKEKRNEIPQKLSDIAMKCLSFNPESRFHKFETLQKLLEELYEELYGETVPSGYKPEESLSSNDWYFKGLSLAALNRHYEAIRCFNESLKKNPAFTESIIAKGDSYFAIELYSDALKTFNKALTINADHAIAHTKKGDCYLKLKRFHDALSCYNKALEIEPLNEKTLIAKGIYFYSAGNYKESIRLFEQALQIAPRSYTALFNLALALQCTGELQKTLAIFERMHSENPRHMESWLKHGQVLEQMGKPYEAIKCMERALTLAPGNKEAWLSLQRNKILTGKYDEALEDIKKRLLESPDDIDLILLMAELQLEESDMSGALQSYTKLISLDKSNIDYKTKQIRLLDRLFLFDKAIEILENMMDGDKENENLKKMYLQISSRKKFHADFIDSIINSAIALPAGIPDIPSSPPEEEKKIRKIISKLDKNISHIENSYLLKIAADFLHSNQEWIALKIIEYSIRKNGETPEAWLSMAAILDKLGFSRNALFAYNRHIQASENGWQGWQALAEMHAARFLYTEAFFFGLKALSLSENAPILVLKVIAYAERAGLSKLLPSIAVTALEKCSKQNFIDEAVTAFLYSLLNRYNESDLILEKYISGTDESIKNLCIQFSVKNSLYSKNYARAEKLFLKIKKSDKLKGDYFYCGGLVYDSIMHDSSAIEMLEKANKDGLCFEADLAKSVILFENNETDKAVAALKKLSKQKDILPEVLIAKAYIDSKTGDVNEGYNTLVKSSISFPTHAEMQMARIMLSIEALSKITTTQIEKYMSQQIMDPRPFVLLSFHYINEGELDLASTVIEQGLTLHPYDSNLMNNKAIMYILRHNKPQADEILSEAIDFDRHNACLLNNIAVASLQKQDYNKALTSINKACHIKRNDISMLYCRLYCLVQNKEYDDVIRELRLGEAVNKNLFSFATLGCLSCLMTQDYKSAEEFADILLDNHPENSAAWMLNGFLLEKMQEISTAIIAYRNSISLDPHNSFSLLAHGKLLIQCGYASEGKKSIETADGLVNKPKTMSAPNEEWLKSSVFTYLKQPSYILIKPELLPRKNYSILNREIVLIEDILKTMKDKQNISEKLHNIT